MFSLEELIIAVFCGIDDLLKALTQGQRIRQRGFAPAWSDAEVITMEIVAEFQGSDQDQAIWKYFRRHWLSMCPKLKRRSTFVRPAANRWQYKQQLQQQLVSQLGGLSDAVHLIDGIPISRLLLEPCSSLPQFPSRGELRLLCCQG